MYSGINISFSRTVTIFYPTVGCTITSQDAVDGLDRNRNRECGIFCRTPIARCSFFPSFVEKPVVGRVISTMPQGGCGVASFFSRKSNTPVATQSATNTMTPKANDAFFTEVPPLIEYLPGRFIFDSCSCDVSREPKFSVNEKIRSVEREVIRAPSPSAINEYLIFSVDNSAVRNSKKKRF